MRQNEILQWFGSQRHLSWPGEAPIEKVVEGAGVETALLKGEVFFTV